VDVLVISGLSGGGKSTALHALEDLGAYCVDNVPAPLLRELVALVSKTETGRLLAVCVDARSEEYLERFGEIHDELRREGHRVEVVFLDATRESLVRRYSETRRLHPLGELPDAIDRERALLEPIRKLAERPIDTTTLSGRQLRQLVRDRYGSASRATGAGGAHLRLILESFAYREGVPSEADIVIDSRFLDNPNEREELRPLTGLNEPVAQYVLEQASAKGLLERVEGLVRFSAPRSAAEGRSYLTVAIGCTGGQHRSVALVEELERRLTEGAPVCDPPPRVVVRHRDVGGRR
jgi:UPF0042 nucleotide-binding protein